MLHTRLLAIVILPGIFLLSACSGGPATGQANPDGSVNVDVTLNDFAIKSSVTQFKPGVLYHISVANKGQVGHEFMIFPVSELPDTPGMSGMSGMSMEEYDKIALMTIPLEQLPPGASINADYTFTGIPQGNLELVCLTQGHYEAGMHIPITVK